VRLGACCVGSLGVLDHRRQQRRKFAGTVYNQLASWSDAARPPAPDAMQLLALGVARFELK
jgi:hypothetical protein